jgi:hypothetical protein
MMDDRRHVRHRVDDEPETTTTRGPAPRTDTQPVADRSVTDDRRP